MTFLEEVASVLTTAGLGTLGSNIFASTHAEIPGGNGPYLTLVETPGAAPEYTQDSLLPAYHHARFQLTGRAVSYLAARAAALAAYNALCAVRNQTIGTTFYLRISPETNLFDLTLDKAGRARCAVNFKADKRPS